MRRRATSPSKASFQWRYFAGAVSKSTTGVAAGSWAMGPDDIPPRSPLREFRDLPLVLGLGDASRLDVVVQVLDRRRGSRLLRVDLASAGLELLSAIPLRGAERFAERGDLRPAAAGEVLVGDAAERPGGSERRRGAEGAPEHGDALRDLRHRDAGAGAEPEAVEDRLRGAVVHLVAPVLADVPDELALQAHDREVRRDRGPGHRERAEDRREDRVLEDVLLDLRRASRRVGDRPDRAREDGVLRLADHAPEQRGAVLRDAESRADAVEETQLLLGGVAVGVGEGERGVVDRIAGLRVVDGRELGVHVDGLGEHPVE